MPISAQEIAELRALFAKATPGDVSKGRDDMDSFDGATGQQFANVYHATIKYPHPRIVGAMVPVVTARFEGDTPHEDARLYEALHNRGLALLDEIERLRKIVAELRHIEPPNDPSDDMTVEFAVTIADQREALAEARRVIGFYAEERNYDRCAVTLGDGSETDEWPVPDDGGAQARDWMERFGEKR